MDDIRQDKHYADYLNKEGWTTERVGGIYYFIKKFPIIGSFLKVQRPKNIDFGVIDRLCRKYGVFQIIIEPDIRHFSHESLVKNGFKLSNSPYLPTKTLQIDLTRSISVIEKHFKKDTRRAIRKGSGLAIKSYSSPSEIKKWREAWKKSVNLSRYVPGVDQLNNLRKSFSSSYSIFLTSHNISGSIIGGALFTRSSHGIAYYWYGFTNNEGRTSLSQYSLLYQGILWAKKMGCKVFDFEGIYDERYPNKSWLGFTHFKRSFGGTEVLYPGCYTRFRFPW